jgi:inosose dehydratase
VTVSTGNGHLRNVRFAINPLQWVATADGWIDAAAAPPLQQLLTEIKKAGFTALAAAPPAHGDVAEYGSTLTAAGMTPAPGYLHGPLAEVAAREEIITRADWLAAAHAELGLTELFVASSMEMDTRVLHPARGVGPDESRLAEIVETLTQVAQATQRHGVTSCLHQHVGTWIELEEEVEWILDRIDPDLLALGPDTGHHAWAGTDPVSFISRHASRVRGLHVKDARLTVADAFRDREDADYRDVVMAGLWVEPGRGEIDLRAAVEALPDGFAGWVILEVDRPDLPTPLESARASADWAREAASW